MKTYRIREKGVTASRIGLPTPDTQPELEGFNQPREIVVSGDALSATLAQLRQQGAVVEAADVLGSSYRLHVRWKCQCELCQPNALPSSHRADATITHDDLVLTNRV